MIRTATLFGWLAIAVRVEAASSSNAWRVIDDERESSYVTLRIAGSQPVERVRHSFVVTHGMYGTEEFDRFHSLAEMITRVVPNSNVILIDWSEASMPKDSWFGFPNPHSVAGRIDVVADEAAEKLCGLGLDPVVTTMIGESYGNYVNARVAKHLGGVAQILAMNPASELGGYLPPDLRNCSRCSWSFHTFSMFDTLQRIAHHSVVLETRSDANAVQRHTSGIVRLTERFRLGGRGWLDASTHLPARQGDRFDAIWTLEGKLLKTRLEMNQPTYSPPNEVRDDVEQTAEQLPIVLTTEEKPQGEIQLVSRQSH